MDITEAVRISITNLTVNNTILEAEVARLKAELASFKAEKEEPDDVEG